MNEGLDMLRKLTRYDEEPPAPKPEPPNTPRFYRRREAHRVFMRFEYRVDHRRRCTS